MITVTVVGPHPAELNDQGVIHEPELHRIIKDLVCMQELGIGVAECRRHSGRSRRNTCASKRRHSAAADLTCGALFLENACIYANRSSVRTVDWGHPETPIT